MRRNCDSIAAKGATWLTDFIKCFAFTGQSSEPRFHTINSEVLYEDSSFGRLPGVNDMTNRILQFGTSRFLQAHVDFFVHDARQQGQDIGPITVVKTTPDAARGGRIAAFREAGGFPVRLRGYGSGQLVDQTTQVTSVCNAVDANADWPRLKAIFAHETEIIVSNVGETGYDLASDEQRFSGTSENPPKSFPMKLLTLLFHRFENGGRPLLILPCELVSNNGQVLRALILKISQDLHHGEDFRTWFDRSVIFCDTLVDRIVSEALHPIGAVGEPYGLWAIKRAPGFMEPLQHPCIVYTDDLEPYLRLKLHILNLGHTFLAQIWMTEKRTPDELVRTILKDKDVERRLSTLYEEEIIPGFMSHHMGSQAVSYVKTTLERFGNPFLDHRLSDIAQNHRYKIERRMVDFMNWVKEKKPDCTFDALETIVATINGGTK